MKPRSLVHHTFSLFLIYGIVANPNTKNISGAHKYPDLEVFANSGLDGFYYKWPEYVDIPSCDLTHRIAHCLWS